MTTITLKHKYERLVQQAADAFRTRIKEINPHLNLSEVCIPSVARVENNYIRRIIIKRPLSQSYHEEHRSIIGGYNKMIQVYPDYKKVKILIDVDPV